MARRLEELRRAAGNSQLRAAYEAAIYGLDAVLYRLAMLRTLGIARACPAPGIGHASDKGRRAHQSGRRPDRRNAQATDMRLFLPWSVRGARRSVGGATSDRIGTTEARPECQ